MAELGLVQLAWGCERVFEEREAMLQTVGWRDEQRETLDSEIQYSLK